jgi:hypothetical protein
MTPMQNRNCLPFWGVLFTIAATPIMSFAGRCDPDLVKIIDSIDVIRAAEFRKNHPHDRSISDAAEAELKKQLPAYTSHLDAKQISFSLRIPGLSLEAHFSTVPTGENQLTDFRLNYDPNPSRIRIDSKGISKAGANPAALVKRAFGSKPYTLGLENVRSSTWNVHYSVARGEVVEIHIARPGVEGDDGPLLMIEQMTGKVWFFPLGENRKSIFSMWFMRDLRDLFANKWFASNHHGTWSAQPHESADFNSQVSLPDSLCPIQENGNT